MIALLRAEWRKLFSTPIWWALLAGGAALTALSTVVTILTTKGSLGPRARAPVTAIRVLDSVPGIRNVFSQASSAEVMILVLGLLAITGEYRHATITQTFLTTPVRGRVVIAKLVAYALVGVGFEVVAGVVNVGIALPWLGALHLHTPVLTHDSLLVLVTVLISGALYGLLGVGVGALVRNQVLAVVIALAWMFVVEGLLSALAPSVGKWTPGGAASGLHRNVAAAAHFLPAWAGGLLLAGYAVVFAVLGTRLVLSRDVT